MKELIWVLVIDISTLIVFFFLFKGTIKRYTKERSEIKKSNYPDTARPEDHRVIFQAEINHMQSIKDSQWHITYLCVVLIGAFIAVTRFDFYKSWEQTRYIIAGFSTIVICFDVYQITEHQLILIRDRVINTKHDTLYHIAHFWMTDKMIEDTKKIKSKFLCNNGIVIILMIPTFVIYLILQLIIIN